MKVSYFLFPFFAILLLSLASCQKTSQPSTPYTNIYGKWKIVQEAFDDTNTGILDSNKLNNLSSNDVESIQFNKDSTGTHYITFDGSKNDFNFRWMLINEYSSIQMITSGGDTLISNILSNYDGLMTLKNNTSPVISWYVLKRN